MRGGVSFLNSDRVPQTVSAATGSSSRRPSPPPVTSALRPCRAVVIADVPAVSAAVAASSASVGALCTASEPAVWPAVSVCATGNNSRADGSSSCPRITTQVSQTRTSMRHLMSAGKT